MSTVHEEKLCYCETLDGGHTSQNCEMVENLRQGFDAIKARIHGDFNNPVLVQFGPLMDTQTDILRIIRRIEERGTNG